MDDDEQESGAYWALILLVGAVLYIKQRKRKYRYEKSDDRRAGGNAVDPGNG
jgi:hypothetical protein